LPAHLKRVVLKLSSACAGGTLTPQFDTILERAAQELERAEAHEHGLRGQARQGLLHRLLALDHELLQMAHDSLAEEVQSALRVEAEDELAPFRGSMTPDVFARARDAAVGRLVRARLGLPTIAFE
jgi:hypothetical protein